MFFTGIRADLKNVGNYPVESHQESTARITASAKIMDRGDVKLNLEAPIADQRNQFTFSGSIGSMDIREFNPMLQNIAGVRVDSGRLNRLDFFVRAGGNRAEGELKALYNNLKVSMLKRDKGQKKRRIVSFLANMIIVTANPRPGKEVRVGKILFEREKTVSFFGYIWKSLLTGIQSGIGLKKKK